MKIAFVIYQYDNYNLQSSIVNRQSSGGVERYIANLSKAFVDAGHEVHVFCHKLKGTENKDIIFHYVPAIGFWSPLKIWSFAIMAMVMLKTKQREFDIIHSFGKTLFQDVLRIGGGSHFDYMKRTYPSMEKPILRFSVILNPRHFFNLLLEWAMFRIGRVKRIVCNSQMCKDELAARYHIRPDSVDVIYNGVDVKEFVPVNKKESRQRLVDHINVHFNIKTENDIFILFVGTGFKRKGLKYAIESLSFFDKDKNVRLIVVGRGRFEGYRRLAEELEVSDRVIHFGPSNDVKSLYDVCDIFVFPTEYDAFPNVCLEAMAMELPIIVSRSSGVAEIINDGVDGYIVDYPIDPKEIAKRIELLTDAKPRVDMGTLAREKALEYSVQSNAKKTLQLYKEILDMA